MKFSNYRTKIILSLGVIMFSLILNTNPIFSDTTNTFKLVYKGSGLDDPIDLSNGLLAAGDVNNDGKNELIFAELSGEYIHIYKWNGKAFDELWKSEDLGYIRNVAVGDIDNDSISEIIASAVGGKPFELRTVIYKWNGEGYIKSSFYFPSDYFEVETIGMGDVTNDGKNELIFGGVKDRGEEWSLEDIVVWSWNGKDFDVISKSPDHAWIANLLVVDIDGDNKNELIVDEFEEKGRDSFRALNIYRYNKTTGSLEKDIEAQLKTDYDWTPTTQVVLWKERGKKRLIVGRSELRKCSFEDSKLTFVGEPFKIPTNSRDLIVGDVDNDGKDEIIISGFGTETEEETALFIYKKPINIFLIIIIVVGAVLIIVLVIFFFIRTRKKKKATTT